MGCSPVGEIYKDDLNDSEAAQATFQEFLRRYPHNRLADDARRAIVELNEAAQAEEDRGGAQEPRRRNARERAAALTRRCSELSGDDQCFCGAAFSCAFFSRTVF